MTLMNELIDLISMGPFGSDIKVENFISDGVPVLNGSNVSSIKLIETSFKYVSPEKSKALKKANAKRGDIVITHRGTVGQISYIPENSKYDNYVISQSQFRVSLKRDLVDPIYFTYYFHTDEGQKRLLSFKSHVGVPALAQATTNFRLLEFPLIPLSEQKKIAKVLSVLDTKMELNNRINTELEAMAKTIYNYWFVQFDFPDANGKPYKTFGGKMVWNEELKREIPEGWENGCLSDIANITMGQSPPGESYNEEGKGMIFYQGCTDFGNRSPTIRKFTTSPTRFAKQGDILLSVRAPVGTLNISKEDCCIGRGLACMNSKNDAITYLFGVMVNLKQIFDRRNVSGTTFGSITKDDLFSLPVIVPNEKTVRAFQNLVFPAFEKQNKIELENIELASLRDWLLPMLMNGQVSVGDVEVELGMVAEPVVEYKEIKTNKTRTDKSEAFLKKVMLGCHLVYRFHQEREFGHIKFMKLLYLCEQVGEMNLMTNYQKAAAGPFDKKTLASIEKYIQTSGWFKINKEPYTGSNGKVYERTFYSLTGKSTDYQKYYYNYFESEKDKIEKLIQLFKGANSRKCEIVATTYYTYNELLKKNVLINENSLIKGFFEFHPQKGKNFKEFDVKEQLPWMKNNGVYPKRQIL